jgi:hypothetical protein
MIQKKHIMVVLRLIIAGTFIFSAVSKLSMPGYFEILLMNQGLFSDRHAAAFTSRLLIGGELAMGLLYLQPFLLKNIVIPLSAVVLIAFSMYLVFLLARGSQENCGCFGALANMTPLQSLLKNGFLIVLVVIAYKNAAPDTGRYFFPFVIVMAAFAVTLLAAPVHAQGDVRFSQYTQFEGEGIVDLAQGTKLVAVFNVTCEHCQAVASELGIVSAHNPHFPKVYVLFYREDETPVDFFATHTDTHFPYHVIGPNEFFGLIGDSPPRIYVLQNGVVEQTLDENIVATLSARFGATP